MASVNGLGSIKSYRLTGTVTRGQVVTADGLTQGRGYVLRGAWAPIKNMTMKATYFINDRNYDTPTEVDYRRLQLDLNYRF